MRHDLLRAGPKIILRHILVGFIFFLTLFFAKTQRWLEASLLNNIASILVMILFLDLNLFNPQMRLWCLIKNLDRVVCCELVNLILLWVLVSLHASICSIVWLHSVVLKGVKGEHWVNCLMLLLQCMLPQGLKMFQAFSWHLWHTTWDIKLLQLDFNFDSIGVGKVRA